MAAGMDDKELEDLLDSTLDEFSDEPQNAASQPQGAAGGAAPQEVNKEALRVEVTGKFKALMAIFTSDVKLEAEYLKEFQELADKQLALLEKACEESQCATAGFMGDGLDPGAEAAMAQAVKETVEMLKQGQGGAEGANEEEVMKKFSEQLQGLDNDPSMQGVMESMMQQLLSKEFLHEPLLEIAKKYPEWLDKNSASLSAEDKARYSKQLTVVKEICTVYENDPENMDRIVELIQEMQQCGQPPAEIVKELGAGVEMDENGLPKFPPGAEGCTVM
mmetsp:Transcript_8536/g.13460  ORF Transcript_8536/g.13460 Transcript_8536/m.13460 type:complete len:276 (-) Transcript_8536:97-924(-)